MLKWKLCLISASNESAGPVEHKYALGMEPNGPLGPRYGAKGVLEMNYQFF